MIRKPPGMMPPSQIPSPLSQQHPWNQNSVPPQQPLIYPASSTRPPRNSSSQQYVSETRYKGMQYCEQGYSDDSNYDQQEGVNNYYPRR